MWGPGGLAREVVQDSFHPLSVEILQTRSATAVLPINTVAARSPRVRRTFAARSPPVLPTFASRKQSISAQVAKKKLYNLNFFLFAHARNALFHRGERGANVG